MIGVGMAVRAALRLLSSPGGLFLIAIAVVVVSYSAGRWQGYIRGETAQVERQKRIDQRDAEQIRERVQHALDEIGAGSNPDDVDRILRGLAGNGAVFD